MTGKWHLHPQQRIEPAILGPFWPLIPRDPRLQHCEIGSLPQQRGQARFIQIGKTSPAVFPLTLAILERREQHTSRLEGHRQPPQHVQQLRQRQMQQAGASPKPVKAASPVDCFQAQHTHRQTTRAGYLPQWSRASLVWCGSRKTVVAHLATLLDSRHTPTLCWSVQHSGR